MISDQVRQYVAGLVVPQTQRLTLKQVANQDERDARMVLARLDRYQESIYLMVEQLRKFTGKDFPIEFERHYRRGLADPNGTIIIDYATLRKPLSEMALTLAHEWAHQSLGHLTSSKTEWEMESEADYWAGIFLGYFGYNLEEVIKIKLRMPEMDQEYVSQHERACLIAQGHVDGQQMRMGNLHPSIWPGFEAFRSQFHVAPWHVAGPQHGTQLDSRDNSARKLSR